MQEIINLLNNIYYSILCLIGVTFIGFIVLTYKFNELKKK